MSTTSRSIAVRKRRTKYSAVADHLNINGRAYISGMLPVLVGFVSGWTAVLVAGGIAYYGAARLAMDSLARGGADVLSGLLRGLWFNGSAYLFVVAGGLFWPIAPFAGLFLALWAFPAGCAVPLLFSFGAKGGICAVLCVILPLLCALLIFLRAWARMLKGAKASLHGERVPGYAKASVLGVLWLLPVCAAQCILFPLLFRGICALFFK